MTTAALAAVRHDREGPFSFESVELDGPRADEVRVRLVSSGICRTDVEFAKFWPLPAVLGHEGAGIVEEVGANVAKVVAGDAVVVTFRSCGTCPTCLQAAPSYCSTFDELNFSGRRPDGTSAISSAGRPLEAHFLGQSSFATHVIAHHSSVVSVPSSTDLTVVGPIGCGFQTGAGTILNVLRPRPGASVVVFGTGAVGLAAVMAAAVAGCHPIVAVDVSDSRLDLARSLGAHHGLSARSATIVDDVMSVVPAGFDCSIDTTGLASVVSNAVTVLNRRGTCAVVGVGPSERIELDWRTVLNGRTITGVVGGASLPDVFIPQLVDLYERGRFPIDRLIQRFPFDRLDDAFTATDTGTAIKAVVTF